MPEEIVGGNGRKTRELRNLGPINDIVAPFRAEGKTFCSEMRQTYEFLREKPAKKIA